MAEDHAEVPEAEGPMHFPTLSPLLKWTMRGFRGCCTPGVFLLIGTILPHVMEIPLNFVWRSYFHLLRDNHDFFVVIMRSYQTIATLGVISFVIALRVALRPRRVGESKWDLNRCAATLALMVFAASAIHTPARTVYYQFSQSLTHPARPPETRIENRLYEVGQRVSRFAADDPEKYYPALSRMDKRYPVILPKALWGRDGKLSTPGLPLRVMWEGRAYYYLGYRVRDDKEVGDYAQAYRQALADPVMTEYLSLEPAGWARLGIYPIPSRVPGLSLPDRAWSGIPLLIEAIDLERATEGTVLFADGHAERVAYPGHWPMTEATLSQLKALVDESLRTVEED